MTEPAISLSRIVKRFGAVTAIRELSFDIADNEFFTLLGPSGCGKTTLLRMIAGFEATSDGEIFLYGEEIERLPPNRRPVNTVFQSYALFPHMSVAGNVGFGLRMLDWTPGAIAARVEEMLRLVKLDAFAARRPAQLSGGQQQRVALARAMAPKPKVLLLDEPLSALDLKLRQAMRGELKQLQRDTGITFVFVTHDQEEALSMSDRIAVMSQGLVQQIGTPTDIYESPANRFVADFVGETNFIDAETTGHDPASDRVTCRLAGGDTLQARVATGVPDGTRGVLSIRPERLALGVDTGDDAGIDHASGSGSVRGTLVESVYLGTDRQHRVALADGRELTVRSQNASSQAETAVGMAVRVAFDPAAAVFLTEP